jgi:hypothetical protein
VASQIGKGSAVKHFVSPHQKGGFEKSNGSVSSFVRIEIEKLLKRWLREPHLYSDCPSFRRDMKEKFIDCQASPDPEDFPVKADVKIRSASVVTSHIKLLIDQHGIPDGVAK